MVETIPMSVRLKKETKERLSNLSQATNSSQAALAAEAIEAFVELNEWQVAQSAKAIAEADAGGPFVAHEEVRDWLQSWGGEDEKPAPDATIRRP